MILYKIYFLYIKCFFSSVMFSKLQHMNRLHKYINKHSFFMLYKGFQKTTKQKEELRSSTPEVKQNYQKWKLSAGGVRGCRFILCKVIICDGYCFLTYDLKIIANPDIGRAKFNRKLKKHQ